MITPIMIAIIVDALRAVPRVVDARARSRSASTAGARCGRSRVRAARPAIVAAAVLATARALGEAIMLSMVSGSVGFAPNPLDGLTFFFEPLRPLAATIVDNAEGLVASAVRRRRSTRSRAVLLVSALFLSLAGWAVKQPLRSYGVRADGASTRGRRRRRPAPPLRAARDGASRSWPLARPHRRSACAGRPGSRSCAIAAAIVIYMACRGHRSTCARSCSSSHPPSRPRPDARPAASSTRCSGTLLLTVIGIAIAVPLGVATAVWLVEYGRPAWLARAVESGVEIIAGTPSIVLAIFGLLVFQQGFFGFALVHGRGRRRLRPLVPHRRAR